MVALVIPLLMYAWFASTMGDMDQLMNRNNTGVVLLAKDGEKFYSTGTADHREPVPLNKMSDSLKKAVIASEDKDFYQHSGVSIFSTLRAVFGFLVHRGNGFGGSTLTQQLAKITVLSSERSFLRQYQAMSVALAIEQRYSKDEILTMYLNAVYFGENAFGIEAAAKNYFGKTPADLTLAESAMLVGVLPSPSNYSPISGSAEKAKERQQAVLERMVATGAITEAEKTAAEVAPLAYQPAARNITNDAPHFTEMVLAELYEKYGEEHVKRSGMQVTTTLDLGLQRTANQVVAEQRRYIQNLGGSNASVIAVDPKTFAIRSLVGSVDYGNQQWGAVNMATTPRQPASTFKPLYYAAALANGTIRTSTKIRDEKINIDGYAPENALRRYYGDVTVRQALSWSLNIPSVKIMQQYGVSKSIDAAKSLGVTAVEGKAAAGLSLAIGSVEVPLQQMTGAYAAFANGGELADQTTLREVKDKYNKVIYQHQPSFRRGISQTGAYLISHILSDQKSRATMFGSALNVSGKTVAVKTGTTNDNRDAWTIGYTPDIAIGTWVGNNDNSTMISGGADMAGPIWRRLMASAIGQSNPSFVQPNGVVERSVCYSDGGLANYSGNGTYQDVFLSGVLPPAGNCQEKKVETPKVEETPKTDNSSNSRTNPSTTPNPQNGGTRGNNNGGTGNNQGGNGGTGNQNPGTGNNGGGNGNNQGGNIGGDPGDDATPTPDNDNNSPVTPNNP